MECPIEKLNYKTGRNTDNRSVNQVMAQNKRRESQKTEHRPKFVKWTLQPAG